MTNGFYNPSGTPSTGASGSSAPMRSEFTSIAAGFALMPTLSGNGGKAVIINVGGTALTTTTGQLALAGNFATTGAFNTTLAQTASVTLTLPAVSGTLATLAGAETFSNKTLVAPALGTPLSGVLTNCTGTASGLTAGTVTTNANLNGPITSSGNTTSVGAQTGTGNTFVMNTSPTLVTPVLGIATATNLAIGGAVIGANALAVIGHVLLEGVTSTGATGTGNFVYSIAPTLTGHPTIEGVTSTGATGSGNLVFSASPTFTGTLIAAHVTVEGVTSTGATGTGSFVFATSPTLVTPVLGVATGTSLALGGATLGTNALAVTGTVLFNTALAVASGGTGAGTLTGLVKGNGTSAFTAATNGTDYVAPTLVGTLIAGTQAITGGQYQGSQGKINTLGSITGTNNIDYTLGNVVSATQNNAALTFTFTNWPASGTYGSIEIVIAVDATPHSVTITGVSWDVTVGAPSLTASKTAHIVLETIDGGSTVRGTFIGCF